MDLEDHKEHEEYEMEGDLEVSQEWEEILRMEVDHVTSPEVALVSCQYSHYLEQSLSCLTSQMSCFQVWLHCARRGLNLIWHLSWLFADDCKFPKLSSRALHSIFQFSKNTNKVRKIVIGLDK